MKILFSPTHYIYDSTQHGTEFFDSYFVATTLSKHWPASTVIVGRNLEPASETTKVIEIDKKINAIGVTFVGAMIFALRYSAATYLQLRRHKYDILHHVRPFLVGSTINPIVLLNLHRGASFVVGPFCSPYDPETDSSIMSRPLRAALRFLSIRTLQKADLIFVYDDYTKEMISQFVNPSVIKVTPPTISDGSYSPRNNQKSYQGDINILSVGHLIPRKRFDHLLYSFQKAAKKNGRIKLTIIGEGTERAKLEALIAEMQLQDRVRLLGFIPNKEIGKNYANAHLFVCLQSAESFGKVYLEAMAAGLPIITSDNVGSRQIVTPDVGLLVQPGDVDGLAEQIIQLSNNPARMEQLSSRAYDTFTHKYDQMVVSRNYINAYKMLMEDMRI